MFGYITCALFLALIGMVLWRASMLRKKGIRAFVFGVSDKSDFILVPCVAAVIYSALANSFGWWVPFGDVINRLFYQSDIPRILGVAVCAAALIVLFLALISFGDSFRVGIDESNPDKLVTSGIFAYTRNPIYVAFISLIAGLFLIYPTTIFVIVLILFAMVIHRQVLREEKFLKSHYGTEYEAYCTKVRRYI